MAAKAKSSSSVGQFHRKPKAKRKGIHAKSKTSTHMKSKNYKKRSRGQG